MRTDDERRARDAALECANQTLATLDARERIEWAFERLPGTHALSSSFGAQSAVSLHLANSVSPGLPIVFVDTGYLFPETYRFVDEMVERLDLNLRVYRAETSAAWQEARHGRRWELGAGGIADYNRENKVEPMQRALADLEVGTWIAGLRRAQSTSRRAVPFLTHSDPRWKLHPLADWSDRDVHRYLVRHGLPYHPLWERGYVSIGDTHTTRTLAEAGSAEATRFFGLTRECGLHEMEFGADASQAAGATSSPQPARSGRETPLNSASTSA